MAAPDPEVVPVRAVIAGLFLLGAVVLAFIAGQVIDTETVAELRAMEPVGQRVRLDATIYNVTPGEYVEYRIRGLPRLLGVCHGEPPDPGRVTVVATYKRFHGRPELYGSCDAVYRR